MGAQQRARQMQEQEKKLREEAEKPKEKEKIEEKTPEEATPQAQAGQKALTVTAPFVTKEYDGLLTATGTSTVGALVAGDSVNVAATLTFDTKMVGAANKTVTPSAMTIKDALNADMTGNYNITYTPNTVSTITQIVSNVSNSQISNSIVPPPVTGNLGQQFFNTFNGPGAGVYFSKLLTPIGSSAFDSLLFNNEALEFIDGKLSIIRH